MFKKRYDDEYLTDSPEEVAAREREEEARRLIRDEIRRIRTGEGAEQMAAEEAEEAERIAAEAVEAARNPRLRHWTKGLRDLFSGEILVDAQVSRFFDYAGLVAMMFFLSIMAIFWSLRMDMRYQRLSAEVDLLHERAVAFKEQRYRQTSHSSIKQQVKRRGLGLHDPEAPATRIE